MNSTEIKLEDHSEFFEYIKDGTVSHLFHSTEDKINLFWKAVHSVNNLQSFCYQIYDFKKDLEVNLPKIIQNNSLLDTIKLEIPFQTCKFNTTYLHQTLQNRFLKNLSIHYPDLFFYDYAELKNQNYIESLLGCFENCSISELSLTSVLLNDKILKRLEKINVYSIDIRLCAGINTKKYSIRAPKVSLYNISSNQDDFFYKLIENFSNLEDLNLESGDYTLNYFKLKRSLNDRKLKNLTFPKIQDHKNEEYLKEILPNITNELNIGCYSSYGPYRFPLFTYLKENTSLKIFNGGLLENYTDLDEFLQNNQNIIKLKLSMKIDKQHKNIEEQIKKLGNGILKNHSLENLNLKIPLKNGFEYLYKGMINKNNLKKLKLSHIEMNDEACKLFGDYLNNNCLTHLKLDSLKLSTKSFILNSIMKHKSLKSLKLYHISIREEVYKCFKELLISNQHLIELKVTKGKINQEILKFISEGLLFNFSLTDLYVDIDDIEFIHNDEFEMNLFYNQTLKNINFGDWIKINKDSNINSILKRNSSLIQAPKQFFTMKHHDIYINFN